MMIRKLTSKTGISLLEVMVAMIILSLALLTLLNMAMVALDGNNWSNNTTIAVQLMQQKMEQLRSSPNLTSGSDTTTDMVRNWQVTNAGNHLRKVKVEVLWNDIRDKTKSSTITSLLRTDSL